MFGYIYLILEIDSDGKERHKIGFTKNDPEKRIKSLQTGNSNKLSLLKSFKTKNYKLLEKWLHGKFFNQKTETDNEWFKLTNEQVMNFVGICDDFDKTINKFQQNKLNI